MIDMNPTKITKRKALKVIDESFKVIAEFDHYLPLAPQARIRRQCAPLKSIAAATGYRLVIDFQ